MKEERKIKNIHLTRETGCLQFLKSPLVTHSLVTVQCCIRQSSLNSCGLVKLTWKVRGVAGTTGGREERGEERREEGNSRKRKAESTSLMLVMSALQCIRCMERARGCPREWEREKAKNALHEKERGKRIGFCCLVNHSADCGYICYAVIRLLHCRQEGLQYPCEPWPLQVFFLLHLSTLVVLLLLPTISICNSFSSPGTMKALSHLCVVVSPHQATRVLLVQPRDPVTCT